MENSVLQHYGVRGMKWGVRRYQNKDGSLTPAGRKRYTDGEPSKKENAQVKKVVNAKTASAKTTSEKTSPSPQKKNLSEMSDEELSRVIRRLQLEKQYKDLNPRTVSAGEKFVKTVMNQVITPAATEAGKQVLKDYLVKSAQKALNSQTKTK